MIVSRRSALRTGFAASLPLPAIAQTPLIKVAIGHITPGGDFLPLIIARDKGFFAQRGIDAQLRRIPIVTNIPAALMSGDLQIGACTVPLLLQTNDGGLDLQLIAGGSRHRREAPYIGLITRSSLRIEKPEDLRGRKIGVAGFNSTMDIFLRKWLVMKGVDPASVTRVEAIFTQMSDLLKAGTIDAATITEPFRTLAVNAGTGTILADYIAEVAPDILMIGYMAKSDFALANPAVIKGFREAMDEAIAYALANPAEAKAIELKSLGFNSVNVSTWSSAVRPDDLDIYLALGKEFGLYRNALDAAKLVRK